jgi:hypothetical protein
MRGEGTGLRGERETAILNGELKELKKVVVILEFSVIIPRFVV